MRAWAVVVAAAVSMSGLVVVGGAPPALAAGDDSPSVPARPLNPRVPGPRATDVTDPAWLHPAVTPPSAGTADVALPATGYAHAGSLPVYVAATDQSSPASVRVQVFDQPTAADLGAQFFVVRVTRNDGSRYEAPVSIQIDYSGVRRAYGGNFASRLRLQRLDACVLTDPACATPVDVPARADLAAQRLVADVVAEADPTAAPTADPLPGIGPSVYPMSSGQSGETGTYTASPMPMTDRWQVGPGSGDFEWSYPIPVPPPVGGPAPSLSLDYSSQSVDGRTLASNSQPSQVGEGWSLENGYIERRFVSCSDDGWGTGANAKLGGNLCWAPTMAYFLHLGGRSGEIVQSTSTNEWRLRDDPAWRIQSWTGATNGDNDGEYFTLYTPDGTKYWFGYGIEPRNTPTRYTNSTLNVPVFAGTSGEPCYNAVAVLSYCSQAWRWNLDRVQDPAQNVESLFYAKETNYFTRDNTLSSAVSQYDRASEPSRIEYSKRSGSENAAAPSVVTFTTAHRCTAQSACPTPSPSNGSSYPDVPLELMCTSSTSCNTSTQAGPSFWSTEEITRVTTYILNSGGGLSDVDTVDLAYSFPVTTDNTDPSLWLRMITRSGVYGGGSIALPSVLIGGLHLPNRVDYDNNGGVPQTDKYRVNQIVSETGGETDVTYGTPDPCSSPYPSDWSANTTDCFPQYYDPPGTPPAGFGIFHKYLVTQVVDDDLVGVSPNRTTTYTYEDTPAWHYANELNLPLGVQSWSDYRGYSKVKVVRAGDADTKARTTRFHIYRGMNGDKLAGGGTRSATVLDEDSNPFTDYEYLAGRTLETDVFSPSGTRFQKQQHRYWKQQTLPGPATAVWPSLPHSAQYVRESVTADLTVDTSPSGDLNAWRSHQVDNTYSATYGVLTSSYDYANSSLLDTCRKLTYAVNVITSTNPSAEAWVIAVPYQDRTVDGVCTGGTVVKNTDLYYDGSTTLGATPTWGRVTQTTVAASPSPASTTKVGYDGYNRVISATSPNGAVTGTVYTPSSGFPYTSVKVNRPLGVSTTTKLEPAWSTPVQVTDANANATIITRDELGRITAVQRPDDTTANPSTKYVYVVAQGSPSRVNTQQLLDGTDYVNSFVYYDGFGDAIESHTESPGPNGGRVVTSTKYDLQGNPRKVSAPFWNSAAIGTGVVNPTDTNVPVATEYRYDSVGRRTDTVQLALDVPQWTSSVTHFEWSDLASYPVHSDVTTDLDVFGRPKDVVERPSGQTATTSYGYTLRGDLASVTDAAGYQWTYAYDLAGRRTDVTADPDRGTSHYAYDADGNALTATDGAGTTVSNLYDALDRRTSASVGATTLATWAYDTATLGKGLPASTTRIVNGNSYTVSMPGYDSRGRPTGVTYTIPAAEGGLAGTYAYTFDAYDAANHRTKTTYPAVGTLLAAEQVTTGYGATGYPTTLAGASTYIGSTTYGNFGQLVARQLGSPTDGIARTYGYGTATHRLNAFTAALTHAGVTSTVQSDTLAFDADDNVVSDTDATTGQTECFRYADGLDRLTAAFTSASDQCTAADTTGPDPYDLAYTYDQVGRTAAATDGGVTVNPAYPATPTALHPIHGMSTYGTTALTYDGNGMVVTRTDGGTASTFGYDPLHALASVTPDGGTATTYVTDADGNQLIRHDPDGTGTLYLPGMEITAPLTAGASPTTTTRYYGPASRIAGGTDAGLWWQVGNQQNSATVTVNATTGAVRTQRYRPYGAHRHTPSFLSTHHGFLDQTEEVSPRLDDLGARRYDPNIGQFTSPDPLTNPAQPQSLNPYAYSRNNPTTLSDPSGRSPGCSDDGLDCETRQENYAKRAGQNATAWVAAKVNAAQAILDRAFHGNSYTRTNAEQALLCEVHYQYCENFTGNANRDLGTDLVISGIVTLGVVGIGAALSGGITVAVAETAPVVVTAGAAAEEGIEETTEVAGTAVEGGLATEANLAQVTEHLNSIDALASHPPNAAMIARVQDAMASGRVLTTAEQNFMTHELTEAELMSQGVEQDLAHQMAGQTHPTFANYDPEVIKQFPEYFNSNWWAYWGIS